MRTRKGTGTIRWFWSSDILSCYSHDITLQMFKEHEASYITSVTKGLSAADLKGPVWNIQRDLVAWKGRGNACECLGLDKDTKNK